MTDTAPASLNGDSANVTSASVSQSAPPAETGWLRDYGRFLREHKAWWLLPLCVTIAMLVWLAWATREPPRPPTYPSY